MTLDNLYSDIEVHKTNVIYIKDASLKFLF